MDARGRELSKAEERTVGVCGGIAGEWDWRLEHPTPEEMAVMVDRNAQLLTRPEFGCALHEATR